MTSPLVSPASSRSKRLTRDEAVEVANALLAISEAAK